MAESNPTTPSDWKPDTEIARETGVDRHLIATLKRLGVVRVVQLPDRKRKLTSTEEVRRYLESLAHRERPPAVSKAANRGREAARGVE